MTDLPPSINITINGEVEISFPIKLSYTIVCVIGIIGNTIFILSAFTRMIKVTEFVLLLLNISLANVIMNIFFFPYLFIDLKKYDIGSPALAGFLCSVVGHHYPVYAAFEVNSMTLCYVSFARICSFAASESAKIFRLKRRTVRIFVVSSWLICVASTLPSHFMFNHQKNIGCIPKDRKLYTIHLVVGATLSTVIPQTILIVNFVRTIYYLLKQRDMIQSFSINHIKQIVFLLLGLTVAYVLFTLPYMIASLLHLTNQWDDKTFENRKQVIVLVGMLTSITDPIFYAICWKGFRDGFSQHVSKVLKNKAYLKNMSKIISPRRSNTINPKTEVRNSQLVDGFNATKGPIPDKTNSNLHWTLKDNTKERYSLENLKMVGEEEANLPSLSRSLQNATI